MVCAYGDSASVNPCNSTSIVTLCSVRSRRPGVGIDDQGELEHHWQAMGRPIARLLLDPSDR
jgi:hypothetical protein